MAKIRLQPWAGNSKGAINAAAVASIKQPSSPLVLGRNQQSDTLYMPRYNRKNPVGGQTEVRKRYCACAQKYSRFSDDQKASLRLQAANYGRAAEYDKKLTAYTFFLKACLKKDADLTEIDQIHIEQWNLGWTGGYTFDIPADMEGMTMMRCEGSYNSGYGFIGQGVWCPVYDAHEEGHIWSQCNSRIKEDDNYLGPYLNVDLEVEWITERAHGFADFYFPEPLSTLQIGILTSQYVFVYLDLTYTLFEVII